MGEISNVVLSSLLVILTTLLTGKLLRKIVLIIFDKIASMTENKLDDELVDTAKKDLGVSDTTIDGKDE